MANTPVVGKTSQSRRITASFVLKAILWPGVVTRQFYWTFFLRLCTAVFSLDSSRLTDVGSSPRCRVTHKLFREPFLCLRRECSASGCSESSLPRFRGASRPRRLSSKPKITAYIRTRAHPYHTFAGNATNRFARSSGVFSSLKFVNNAHTRRLICRHSTEHFGRLCRACRKSVRYF